MRTFTQLDVFTSGPSTGNPLAVVGEADDLADGDMKAFARWTMLSETTFLLPPEHPDADYRARIFTPRGELPFAGHPTLGSACAWRAAGGEPRTAGTIVQECAAGLIEVRERGDTFAFRAPKPSRTGPLDDEALTEALACLRLPAHEVLDHQWGVNGPRWAMIQVADADVLRGLHPDNSALSTMEVGVVALTPGTPYAYEVRAFPPAPMREDPVTGSLNAAAAQWLRRRALVPEAYRVLQGTEVGARGEVTIDDAADGLWVGGRVASVVSGTVDL